MLVDTFQQLGFIHDLHSTINMNIALTKLPIPVRLEWNRYVLEKTMTQPSLKALAEWLLNYAKACRNLPTNSNLPSSQNIGVHKMAWKTSHSTGNNENPKSKHQLLSNREQGQFQSKTKESVSCPNNDYCQYLYKCIHFQALSPPNRKDHVMCAVCHLFCLCRMCCAPILGDQILRSSNIKSSFVCFAEKKKRFLSVSKKKTWRPFLISLRTIIILPVFPVRPASHSRKYLREF